MISDNLIALISIVTFLVGYLEKRAYDRRRRTLDFFLTIMKEDGPIHEANLQTAIWVRDGVEITGDEVNAEDDKTIIKLLDFFDLVADSALRNVVDREMVILHLGGRMRSKFNLLKGYIYARRDRIPRSGMYVPLETFVTRYVGDRAV